VFGWGLRHFLAPSRLALTLVLAVGVGFLGSLIVRHGDPAHDEVFLLAVEALDFGVLLFALPLIALLAAGTAFSREERQRTLVYLLVRPVSRATVFLARFISSWLPAAVASFAALAACALLSGVAVPASLYGSLALVAAAGSLALCAAYYVLSVIFRHGVIAGITYTFLFEVMLGTLPGTMQTLTIRYHLSSLYHALVDPTFSDLSPQVARLVEAESQLAPEGAAPGEARPIAPESLETALLVLGILTAVLLAYGAWRVKRRDFALKD
jgi:ABC-type transport system involved in multi-copper enzyme maturation permease subunit